MESFKRLRVRAYGILINHRNEVLLSHEQIGETRFTKFPGGGLKLGESPQYTLKREFLEELELVIGSFELFHIPDFPVSNHFFPEEQVVLIYYKVRSQEPDSIEALDLKAKFLESFQQPNTIVHEWVSLLRLDETFLTFPADKQVAGKLAQKQQ